jgi:hypothetical protein
MSETFETRIIVEKLQALYRTEFTAPGLYAGPYTNVFVNEFVRLNCPDTVVSERLNKDNTPVTLQFKNSGYTTLTRYVPVANVFAGKVATTTGVSLANV